ncbi:MAG: PAS domain S-box protein [Thermodesulfobacteriota bacterium]
MNDDRKTGKQLTTETAPQSAGEQYRALYEKAKQQEELYVSLLNSSSDAIVIYDTDRRIMYINPSHTRIFGWTLEEARGNRLPVVPEWDRAETDIIVERALKHGIPCSAYETQRYTKWGTLVEIGLSASPYYDHQGKLAGVLVIYRDISARKHAETALRLMSKVFREGIDPIIIADLEGIILDVNDAAEHTYGWSREELIGQPFNMAIPTDCHDQVNELQEQCKKGAKIRNVESVRYTRAGRTIPVLMSLSLLTDDKGTPVGIASIAQNLTDLKRTEEQLRDRTKALEQSNQELEQFAYVAAHDLREPLLAVAGYLRMLERRCGKNLDDHGISLLMRALDVTSRMDALIGSLLAYSRLGSETEAFELTDFNLIMSKALDNLRSTIEHLGATVTHQPLPTLMANPSQMVQLLQNLVGNAVKFVRERSPVVSVHALQGEADWVFIVRDNGIGIHQSDLPRIFLPFERVHGRDEFPGTGIGLANCKKIVERHGGRLWVDSTPGEGSTFFFSLPDRPCCAIRSEGNGQ